MIGITFNACCLPLRSTLDACRLTLVACRCAVTIFFGPFFMDLYYLRLSDFVLSAHDIARSGLSYPSTRDTVRIHFHFVARDKYRLSCPL